MKKGVIVLLSLGLLLAFCAPVMAQPSSRAVETFVIDTFDGNSGAQNYKYDGKVFNWEWKVQASRFIYKNEDSGEAYPMLDYFEGMPNSLKALNESDATPMVLGVKTRFSRKGENWFEVYPSEGDKAIEIPLKGTVSQIDFWVWGAKYLYFIDILVRDADGRVHSLPAGNLNFNGWRNLIVKVPTHLRQHSRLRSGPDSMTFVGFRVRTDPDEYVDDFNIYFDQLKYTANTLAEIYDGYELRRLDFKGGDGSMGSKSGSSSSSSTSAAGAK